MDWDKIIKLATEKLGISYHAAHQWKTRNTVPHRHRFALVRASGGKISHADLEHLLPRTTNGKA